MTFSGVGLKVGRKNLAIQSKAGGMIAAIAKKIRIGPYCSSMLAAPPPGCPPS
jgi:hypothetical protein